MNLHKVITEIEKVDPEVYERMDSRRNAMKGFANMAGKLALAAVPIALGSMFKKAYGQSGASILQVLQYALTLEHLEYRFYQTAVTTGGLIPAGAAATAIATIRDHELAHVNFLKQAIMPMGTPVPEPTFDFSGGNGSGTGPFAGVFGNYGLFLAVAQTFEDTGVRAYKGAAADLISNNAVLTAALNIHSVEARHAAHIRQMRRANGSLVPAGDIVKPWITGKKSNIASPAVQPSYDGEENTLQATIQIMNINGLSISADAASEAFDEPLSMTQVGAIIDGFIV
jgi:hypothetical protein